MDRKIFLITTICLRISASQTLTSTTPIIEGNPVTLTCETINFNYHIHFEQNGINRGGCLSGGFCSTGISAYNTPVQVGATKTSMTITSYNDSRDKGDWICSFNGWPSPQVRIEINTDEIIIKYLGIPCIVLSVLANIVTFYRFLNIWTSFDMLVKEDVKKVVLKRNGKVVDTWTRQTQYSKAQLKDSCMVQRVVCYTFALHRETNSRDEDSIKVKVDMLENTQIGQFCVSSKQGKTNHDEWSPILTSQHWYRSYYLMDTESGVTSTIWVPIWRRLVLLAIEIVGISGVVLLISIIVALIMSMMNNYDVTGFCFKPMVIALAFPVPLLIQSICTILSWIAVKKYIRSKGRQNKSPSMKPGKDNEWTKNPDSKEEPEVYKM